MKNTTRALFTDYVSQIALLNHVPSATQKFAVDPSVEQILEDKIRNTSEFLGLINMMPVTQQEGEVLGIGVTRSIAGRTNTAGGTRRNPTDPGGSEQKYTYLCKQTNFDWARGYAILDAWRHRANFEQILRDDIIEQMAMDRQMIGFWGTSAAAQTDRVANPNLSDVNIGWLHKIRTDAPAQVMADGALTVHSNGTDDDALNAIYVKAGVTLFDESAANAQTAEADYSSLDALVLDAKRGIHERYRGDNDLVVIVGHELLDDKYFSIAQETGATASEVESTDRILRSTKMMGGLPAIRVSGFPGRSIMITKLSNLSIYWQEETRRRQLVDEPEYDRVANYESVNEAYVVEEYKLVVLVENIVMGESPTAGSKPAA